MPGRPCSSLPCRRFSAFGLVAFLLAIGGLFAVVALSVVQRRRELALRAALGAMPRQLATLVLGQSLRLALPGVAVGILIAMASGRWLRSLLFGVSALDARVCLCIPVLVIAIMLLATWLPARDASRAEPGSLLRS